MCCLLNPISNSPFGGYAPLKNHPDLNVSATSIQSELCLSFSPWHVAPCTHPQHQTPESALILGAALLCSLTGALKAARLPTTGPRCVGSPLSLLPSPVLGDSVPCLFLAA